MVTFLSKKIHKTSLSDILTVLQQHLKQTAVCVAPTLGPFWDRLVSQQKGDQNRYGTVLLFGTLLTVEKQKIAYHTKWNYTTQWEWGFMTYWMTDRPLLDKCNYTILNSLVQAFFLDLKYSFNIGT